MARVSPTSLYLLKKSDQWPKHCVGRREAETLKLLLLKELLLE